MPRTQDGRKSAYAEKLKDPRWQKMRLEILQRDDWSCQICGDDESTLHVHHKYYVAGKDPWDYAPESLITLCERCHESETITRSKAEQALLNCLREKGLFACDLEMLTNGFRELKFQHLPEVVVTVLEWALQDDEMQRLLLDKFFQQHPYTALRREPNG